MRWKRSLNVVDCHCEGEVGRVITGGLAQVPGRTMFDKKMYFQEHMDDIRKIVLFEPRGAVWHNANVILPSNHPEADMGFLIIETTEYPAMSGSNAICVATVLLETGILPMQEPVTDLTLEAPAGLIRLRCTCADGKVTGVRLVNQPAFVYHRDAMVEVPGHGAVRVDVAFGGMTFALVEASDFGFAIAPEEARTLCDLGEQITRAAAEQLPVSYPGNPQMAEISATVFTGPLTREEGILTSRNTAVISPGRCDRSPCGAGSSARMALLHARGDLAVGETFIHRSITGSRFTCAIDGLAEVGPHKAIIPALAGQAWISGLTQMGLDPSDPYQQGFTLSDTWFGSPA